MIDKQYCGKISCEDKLSVLLSIYPQKRSMLLREFMPVMTLNRTVRCLPERASEQWVRMSENRRKIK